ncbi:hypothetical protein D3C87_1876990 [compost metagenome]
MTVLPVTVMRSRGTFSRRRLSRASEVGARCTSASWVASLRLISSGNGLYLLLVRSPASRCTTGTF